jgi:uncharacterized protein (TIGR03032 family)
MSWRQVRHAPLGSRHMRQSDGSSTAKRPLVGAGSSGSRWLPNTPDHDRWRNPCDVVAHWENVAAPTGEQLRGVTRGRFWETLHTTGCTLLITREYEHFVIALSAQRRPRVSYLPLPHPSGIAVNERDRCVYIASTRNPNQIITLAPVDHFISRSEAPAAPPNTPTMVAVRNVTFPGCLYLHDLALIEGVLHGTAVGLNALVRLREDGCCRLVWWPRCVEMGGRLITDRNLIQLNGIAAGATPRQSYFSASTNLIGGRTPGRRDFIADGRGVVFDGRTRDPIAFGLTRPHSVRAHDRRLWIHNSGYGECGTVDRGRFVALRKFQGWTRGLCFHGRVAFISTSRVISRFARYAPGLDVGKSVCGIHAVDTASGEVFGSLLWPAGDQVFALALVPRDFGCLPGRVSGSARRQRMLCYSFDLSRTLNPRGRVNKCDC